MRENYPKIHDTLKVHQDKVENGEVLRSVEDELPEGIDQDTEVKHGPHIDIDFDKLLKQRDELTNQESLLSEEQIKQILDNLDKNELQKLLEQTVERINQETGYFHEWEEMGVLADLQNGFKRTTVGKTGKKTIVRWGAKRLKGKLSGQANLLLVEITKDKPELEQIIGKLAGSGYLPKRIIVLLHELIHARAQTPHKFKDILAYFYHNYNTELKEVQAMHANRSYPRKKDFTGSLNVKKHGVGKGRLYTVKKIEEVRTDKGKLIYPGVDRDKLIYSSKVMEQLNALGLSIEEVGSLVINPGKWNKDNATYPQLDKIVKDKCDKLGIDELDLENLIQAERLERDIARLKAMYITQEELQKYQATK